MENQKPAPPRYTSMGPANNRAKSSPFALVSLIVGCISLIFFCFPPIQLIFGALAVMFALLSREGMKDKLKGMALAGFITGVLSCLLSFLIFGQALNTLDQLKQDPQYISYLNKMVRDMEQLFGSSY